MFLSFSMGLLIFLVTVSIIVYVLFDEKETNKFPLSGSDFYYSNVYGISFVTIICIMMWFIGDFIANRKSKIIRQDRIEFRIDSETKFRFVLAFSTATVGVMLVQLLMFFKFINSIGGLAYY